jgi:hypothetical protein
MISFGFVRVRAISPLDERQSNDVQLSTQAFLPSGDGEPVLPQLAHSLENIQSDAQNDGSCHGLVLRSDSLPFRLSHPVMLRCFWNPDPRALLNTVDTIWDIMKQGVKVIPSLTNAESIMGASMDYGH